MVDKWDYVAIQLGFNPVENEAIKKSPTYPVEQACERFNGNIRKLLTMQKI